VRRQICDVMKYCAESCDASKINVQVYVIEDRSKNRNGKQYFFT